MNQLRVIILLLLPVMVLPACRKPIKDGTVVRISGVVYDRVKNKNLPGATIFLYGALRSGLGRTYYSHGPLDTFVTDAFGRFSIEFTATGEYIDYGLTPGVLNYGGYSYGVNKNYVIDYAETMFKFNHKINISGAAVKARELNFAKIHLKVLSNPLDSFYVRVYANGLRDALLATGRVIDTMIIDRHLPGQKNVFWYYTESYSDTVGLAVLNSNPQTHHYSIRRMVTDTIYADMRDTLEVAKTIQNSMLMPRQ